QQNGGHIGVHSEPGHGTSFTIYLPRVEAAASSAVSENRAELLAGGGETILLVEDEAAVRTLARRILAAHGYRVIEAAGGNEALHRCRDADAIHLVLTDVVMPGMNGPELVGCLRPILPRSKVLYMSGYADSALDYFRQQGEGVPFLAKPFSPESLLRKIREVLAA
ncbi:MAG: response regulator, partial [Bryobacteraceae bacterium]